MHFNNAGDPVAFANGTKTDYYSNNPLFECLVCSRQVSSNRYATHLEKCMGIGNKAVRKGSARNAKATSSAATQRLLHTNSRSASPATSTASHPRRQGTASPAPSAPPKEPSVKSETRSSTPLTRQVEDTPKPASPAPAKAGSANPSDTSIPRKQSVSVAPAQAAATSAPTQAEDDSLFADADFTSGFDLSVRIIYLAYVVY